ncbi:deleted in autism protein 1 homolog isoform X2 [Anoplophora glabripennis]|nr:deleted in autism protein 1 homolog isoform X2 [Anoplophora glabripennis]
MNTKYVLLTVLSITINVIIYYKLCPSVLQLCEVDTCPICFGTDLCNEIGQNKIVLQYNTFSAFMYNIFSVKNVYFARFYNMTVVLKKLAHNNEFQKLKELKRKDFNELINFLVSDSGDKHFVLCDKNTANSFLRIFSYKSSENLETLLHINIEPLLLEIFSSQHGWCVPKLYGYCGRLVVVQNAGQPLSEIESFNWFDRSYVAYQILQSVNNFTKNHDIFRIYLTDISPDNIAVNQDLQITFIDLENAILKKKVAGGEIHYTEHFDEDLYMYSEKQICESSMSDHNIYSTCRLLLSKKAPWPMMKNGLLHNPPDI